MMSFSQKSFLAGLFIILSCSLSQATGGANESSISVDHKARMETLRSNFMKKSLIAKSLIDILGIKMDSNKDSSFAYAYGKTWLGSNRNLSVELNNVGALLSNDKINDALQRHENNILNATKVNSVIDYGRLALQIEGTEYYHSYVMGNHNKTYRSFYMSFHEGTIVESISSQPNKFQAIILTTYNDGSKLRQKIAVDKSSGQTVVTLSEKNIKGILTTDLTYRDTKITLTTNADQTKPLVEKQGSGM